MESSSQSGAHNQTTANIFQLLHKKLCTLMCPNLRKIMIYNISHVIIFSTNPSMFTFSPQSPVDQTKWLVFRMIHGSYKWASRLVDLNFLGFLFPLFFLAKNVIFNPLTTLQVAFLSRWPSGEMPAVPVSGMAVDPRWLNPMNSREKLPSSSVYS